jgi:hypothetical protein
MKARTEQEMFAMTPLKVKFGAKSYDVKPLTVGPSLEWRNRLLSEATDMITQLKAQGQSTEDIVAGLGQVWFSFPKKLVELIRAYCPDLAAEVVEAGSTEQICATFQGIMQMEFPFLPHLQQLLGMEKRVAASSPSVPLPN